tara:strand:+ start:64 stop:354 length:291 start_codon:yes stop_codon:yes gene_type:complete
MNTGNTDPLSDIKEYFTSLKDATIKGSLKAKALMLCGSLFILGFYTFAVLLLAEVIELVGLQSLTGVLPSTIENAVLAFLFWAGHRYFYSKAKEEL